MDKYKIRFRCHTLPLRSSGLEGFTEKHVYTGRSYNGWFEICSSWGSGKETKLLTKKQFKLYFELFKTPEENLQPI